MLRFRSATLVVGLCTLGTMLIGTERIVQAQTAYPMLMAIKPVAAQVGQASEHQVFARYSLDGAYQVLVSGSGVTGEVIPEPKDEKPADGKKSDEKKKPKKAPEELKVRFTVSADALPGVRDVRIATPRGVSTVGQLVIARDPVISESDKNNTAAEAQQVAFPATLCGTIEAVEDVDTFRFHADAGKSLYFHVRGMRLNDRVHDLQEHLDPILTLRSGSGITLATADNDFAADPFLSYRFAESGDYLLEVRDVRYKGNAYWTYGVEVGDRPFVQTVHPLGIERGKETKIQLVGALLPPDASAVANLPSDTQPDLLTMPLSGPAGPTNPVSLIVTDLPTVLEAPAENNSVASATPITIPCGVSGRMESEADIDCYKFEAKKGEQLSFVTFARRAQSSLDSSIRLLDEKGNQLAENDDLGLYSNSFADSWIENWTAPADGKYTIEVRDLLLRGGPDFVYFLRVVRAAPYFELYVDTDKTQISPGTGGVMFVNLIRKNGFDGDVQLKIDGLPQGVAAHCGRIPAGAYRDGAIILDVPADAKQSVANVTISGTANVKGADGMLHELSAVAKPRQETYLPGGGRGHWLVESHAVCVTAPNDIRGVKLSTYDVSLKPGESKKIDVTIARAEGFTQNVTLDPIFQHLGSVYGNTLPTGVTVDATNSKTLLTGSETQGYVTLVAAKDAKPTDKQLVSMMANISLNFVMKATYSSAPLSVSVAAP